MPLPTTNLTYHLDASDTDKLFTTLNGGGSGIHTGTPGDGGAVQVWDEETDGSLTDVAMVFGGTGQEPVYLSTSKVMLNNHLDFVGGDEYMQATIQAGGTAKALSNFIGASAFTVLVAFQPDIIASTASSVWLNDGLIADLGGFFGIFVKDDSGTKRVLPFVWDGAAKTITTLAALSEDTNYVICFRGNGTDIFASLNGGAEETVSCGAITTLTGALQLGRGATTSYYNGGIGEVAIYDANLTGSTRTDAISYFTQRWVTGPLAVFPEVFDQTVHKLFRRRYVPVPY